MNSRAFDLAKRRIRAVLNRAGFEVRRLDTLRHQTDALDAAHRETAALSGELAAVNATVDALHEELAAVKAELAAERARVAATRLPSVLIVSVPKSGTVFINGMLAHGLRFKNFPISCGYFPNDIVDVARAREFAGGNMVASEHLEPSGMNLQILRHFVCRWVVHIRDPRSVVVSWVHHTDRLLPDSREAFLGVLPMPPQNYLSLRFEEKLSWTIDHFLPVVVHWTRAWLDVIDAGTDQILLTRYDDLRSDERGFVERILDFYAIPRGVYTPPSIDRTVAVSHFRTGRTDEWRDMLSAEQLRRANSGIGSDLLARFGWAVA